MGQIEITSDYLLNNAFLHQEHRLLQRFFFPFLSTLLKSLRATKMNASELPVTVIVPVKNEERNLGECLDCLSGFAKVVVIDSHSTDRTPDIARNMGADLVEFQWNGRFPKKRNWYLRNFEFITPWVLFVDADEFVSPEFKSELASVLPNTHHVGFWITYTVHFMDKPLKHGDLFRKLALFRPTAGEYECIDDQAWSNLDMEVHEHPVLEGTIGKIQSRIQHEDFKGIKAYLDRHNQYSSWEAQRFLALKQQDKTGNIKLTFRQRLKYAMLNSWLFAPMYFMYSFILKLGFLDGNRGLMFALCKMMYFWQIKIKIQEMYYFRQSNV